MGRFFVYMLACSDGSLYTGYTTDIERRLAQHRSGRGSKYVASRLPVALAYVEEAGSLKRAMQREYEIKNMGRESKLLLCGAQKEKPRPSSR
ncbi:MAG: GIY-YIG nuclease family protein [Nitrososphaerota archaeon]|nr:GIY-YIG nuclease family protein [Nitrososphaerota archaeon]MDG7023304.1 GIY-YIG nuclease family protein [Nitrososphaerota archaeon]